MIVRAKVGIEEFVDSATGGWSFLAARTPLAGFATALRRRPEVRASRAQVQGASSTDAAVLLPEETRRYSFALQFDDSPWSVMLRTVGWSTPADAVAVRRMAAELSHELGTTMLASVGTCSGADCRLYRIGRELARVDTNDPQQDFLEFFDELEFVLPSCRIDGKDAATPLIVDDSGPVQVCRIDSIVLN